MISKERGGELIYAEPSPITDYQLDKAYNLNQLFWLLQTAYLYVEKTPTGQIQAGCRNMIYI